MTITLDQIKSLREKTGVSMQSCKNALDEAKGNEEKAIEILRKKGEAKVVEKSTRTTVQGIVSLYLHSNNKMGVILQLACETDFVAKNEGFQVLAKDIAMHVAAMNPIYISPEEVPSELVEKEREIWKAELTREKKPEKIWEQIMNGKEKKFREEMALLTQAFIKNPDVKVESLIKDAVLKLGENIKVVRFTRYAI